MVKQQYRLAIGAPAGRQSGIWRIWSNRKGDVYVANRCLGGVYKASFHKDRRCQFGFTSEHADKAKARFGRNDRHLEKWTLPDATIVRAIQILIPESELRISEIVYNNTITWLESPPVDSIGTISLFITGKNFQLNLPADVPGATIVGRLDTELRAAWIAYAFTTPDDELRRLIQFEKGRLHSRTATMAIPPGARASLWDSGDSHDRHVLELACDSAE